MYDYQKVKYAVNVMLYCQFLIVISDQFDEIKS